MIRPLVKEKELQNLSNMNINQLRPSFQEQVHTLRRKVLQRMKPKTLNGKKLTGSILVTLTHQYVEAINKGAVPNIESAWQYVCNAECQKALHAAVSTFESTLNQEISLPVDENDLNHLIKKAKENAS